jgi:hypothetical protein
MLNNAEILTAFLLYFYMVDQAQDAGLNIAVILILNCFISFCLTKEVAGGHYLSAN